MTRDYGAKAGALSRLRAANSMTALTWSRSRPSYHCRMSSRLAPASRFSKMADTGMRVPFSTHAPLTLPGTLSTAGHCDQSRDGIGKLLLEHTVIRIREARAKFRGSQEKHPWLRSADSRGGCLYVSCGGAGREQIPPVSLRSRVGMTGVDAG